VRKLSNMLLVEDHERPLVSYFVVVFLLLGAGMALGRSSADALFFKRYGIQYLPMVYGVLSIVLAAVSIVYAAYADRLPAERFFRVILGVLTAVLALNWALMTQTDAELTYPAYVLVYEIASELLMLHAALYLAQNLDTLQSKRLSPLIFAAAQIGTILGGILVAAAAPTMGVHNILLLWTALLIAAIAAISLRHGRIGASPYFQPRRVRGSRLVQAAEQITQGLKFTKASPLLRAASLSLFFMVIGFYILSYSINRIFAQTFETEESLSAFFGMLTAATSALALLIQVLVTNRLLHRIGVKKTKLIFPVASVITYATLFLSFTLPAALLGSLTRDVLMPAIRRPTRNLFFNALPDYMQGRTRALAVALVLPLALAVASAILVGAQNLGDTAYFLVPGLIASIGYLYYGIRMNRAYLAAMLESLREKLFIPGAYRESLRRGGDPELVDELLRGAGHRDDAIAAAYAGLLVESCPEHAADAILPRLRDADIATRDRLIRLLAPLAPPDLGDYCRNALMRGDAHHAATAAAILFDQGDEAAGAQVPTFLASDNPRLTATGVLGVLRYGIETLRPQAMQRWQALLRAPVPEANIAGLDAFAAWPEPQLAADVLDCLDHQPAGRLQKAALAALGRLSTGTLDGLAGRLPGLYGHLDPEIRRAAVGCAHLLPPKEREALSLHALEDAHPTVRAAALATIAQDDAGGDALAGLLLGNVGTPRAQSALLDALCTHRPSQDIFRHVAAAKIADAAEIGRAAAALQAASDASSLQVKPARQLLLAVLGERRAQTMDLALQALARIEDPMTIDIIRAGIGSRDRRHFANACEAVRNLSNRGLAEDLADLLEERRRPVRASHSSMPFKSGADVLDWCHGRSDRWLRECAGFLRRRLDQREHEVA
jgi:hypothetical protein